MSIKGYEFNRIPEEELEDRLFRTGVFQWARGFKADYFVFTYEFNSGRDLDTRTYLITPSGESLGALGWCRESSIFIDGKVILDWGGDNMGNGVESVLFYAKNYQEIYPNETRARILLNANWYGVVGSGTTITAIGYLGGEMIPDGFSWFNPTAEKTYANYNTLTAPVFSFSHNCSEDGTRIGIVEVNLSSGALFYLP